MRLVRYMLALVVVLGCGYSLLLLLAGGILTNNMVLAELYWLDMNAIAVLSVVASIIAVALALSFGAVVIGLLVAVTFICAIVYSGVSFGLPILFCLICLWLLWPGANKAH